MNGPARTKSLQALFLMKKTAPTGTDLNTAATFLESGGLVAIPTETVYGLAANALNPEAVIKIFEAKGRPAFDPLIVHVKDFSAILDHAVDVPEQVLKMAAALGPAPVTYVLKKRAHIPDLVTSGLDTVGLRIPNHPLTLGLLQKLKFPLAAPSANPFGYVSPTTAAHVAKQLGEKVDYILDGGPCSVGIESTIIDFTSPTPIVLRLGGFAPEQLLPYLGPNFKIQSHSSSQPKAPGMLSAHYAPSKPVYLNNLDQAIKKYGAAQVGCLMYKKKRPEIQDANQIILSENGDTQEAARNLFAALRAFETLPVACIVAETLPETGLGAAINDRLKRAAHQHQ